MISPLPSYDDELLNSAYANVSLIADEVWTFDPEDPFRKLNHSLWTQVRYAMDIYYRVHIMYTLRILQILHPPVCVFKHLSMRIVVRDVKRL